MKSFLIWWNKRKIIRCLTSLRMSSPILQFSYRRVDGEPMYPSLKESLDTMSVLPNGVVFNIARLIDLSVRKYAPNSDYLNKRDCCINVHGTIDQKKWELEIYIEGYSPFYIKL